MRKFAITMVAAAFAVVLGGCAHQHQFGDWEPTQPATCTDEGTETRTCECGESETQTVAALGHDIVNGRCTRCDYDVIKAVEWHGDYFIDDGTAKSMKSSITVNVNNDGTFAVVMANGETSMSGKWRYVDTYVSRGGMIGLEYNFAIAELNYTDTEVLVGAVDSNGRMVDINDAAEGSEYFLILTLIDDVYEYHFKGTIPKR